MTRKIIKFLTSEGFTYFYLLLIVAIGSIGYYQWHMDKSMGLILIVDGIFFLGFILIKILKHYSPYYRAERKLYDDEKRLSEKMKIFYDEFLPELQKELPKTVYKYIALSPDEQENNKRFSSLENNQVWFSNVNLLNDPYEGRVNCYSPPFTTEKTMFFGGEQKIRDDWNRFVEEGIKRIRVCSFSERKDLMPLWAHYANNNQGYCVEYELLDKHQLCKVFYTACKTDVSFEIEKFMDDVYWGEYSEDERIQTLHSYFKMLTYFKGRDWEYEQELRSVIFLEEETEEKGENIGIGKIGLRIKSIIVGSYCTEENRRHLKEIAQKLGVPCKTSQVDCKWDYPVVKIND